MDEANVSRLIDLLNEYGQAKFGDEWWPGNAGPWIGEEEGEELAGLLEQVRPGSRAPSDPGRDRMILDWLSANGVELATLNDRPFAGRIDVAELREGITGLVSKGPVVCGCCVDNECECEGAKLRQE